MFQFVTAQDHNLQESALLVFVQLAQFVEALNGNQEATAQEALEVLIELADLEEGTKHLATEFVITLAEARERAPGMMKKFPQFVQRLFVVLMKKQILWFLLLLRFCSRSWQLQSGRSITQLSLRWHR
ncbi:uncharacterized protein [Euphorbia lathyris]|uniref:uncharacterized protein n=1 Tax=Euphorbia lathyris TaxID=212925 RepID=UPI003313AE90